MPAPSSGVRTGVRIGPAIADVRIRNKVSRLRYRYLSAVILAVQSIPQLASEVSDRGGRGAGAVAASTDLELHVHVVADESLTFQRRKCLQVRTSVGAHRTAA
jgi:hypothetical protein